MFLHPIERATLLREGWESLPEDLRTPKQVSRHHLTHCGFTTGASDCYMKSGLPAEAMSSQ